MATRSRRPAGDSVETSTRLTYRGARFHSRRSAIWLLHVQRALQPGDHLCLVVLLIGVLPRSHAVAARLDGDDVALGADLAHRGTQYGRLLVRDLIVTRAVDREERRHPL